MQRTLLALAFFGLLLAGCAQPTQNTPTVQPPADQAVTIGDQTAILAIAGLNQSARAAQAMATSFVTGFDSGEPTIGISNSGQVFLTAITFDTDTQNPRTDIITSKDGGRNWTDVSPTIGGQKSHPVTGDPMLYFDADTGRLFDIDQIVVGCDYISTSDDNGGSWTPPTAGCPFPPSDHQTIATAVPSTIPTSPIYSKHVFVCINQVSDTECSRSVDGGLSFQPTTPPFRGVDEKQAIDLNNPGNQLCSGLVGHLKTDAQGRLFLPKDHCNQPMVAISSDEGTTWSIVTVSGVPVADDPAMAVDANGTVYYAWVTPDGALLLSSSKDHGATWSAPIDVRAPGLTAANLHALQAGANGRLALAYYGTTYPGGYKEINKPGTGGNLLFGPQPPAMDNVTWDGYLAEITDAATKAPSVLTMRVNPQDDPLVRGHCGPGRCGNVYDFIDVQIDHEGRPWGAFVDACDQKTHCAAPGGTEAEATASHGLASTMLNGPDLLTGAPLGPLHGVKG